MVSGQIKQNFETIIKTRNHVLIVDVGQTEGGQDRGPNPHEYLEAALAGCTVITIQMYAQRKQWPLKTAEVSVKAVLEGTEGHITREIKLVGELSEEQKKRLLEIADKCPIHKLLMSKVSIDTQLKA